MKTKAKKKSKKIENEKQNENESKNENQNEFSFWFLFLLFKSFCIFVNSMWPRGAIDGQLSLDWLRSAIAFSFADFPRGLAVP